MSSSGPKLPRIKICGLKRAEDARLAQSLGAWALGFVFWSGSPRAVVAREVAEVIRELDASRTLERIGVFVNADESELQDISAEAGLSQLQLHGDLERESPEFCARLGEQGFSWFRAIKTSGAPEVAWDASLLSAYAQAPGFSGFLLEGDSGAARGGSGKLARWESVAPLKAYGRVILAGGLTPENVRQAIVSTSPWAVDVSSGVESAPGIKSADKLERFFSEAQRAVRGSA